MKNKIIAIACICTVLSQSLIFCSEQECNKDNLIISLALKMQKTIQPVITAEEKRIAQKTHLGDRYDCMLQLYKKLDASISDLDNNDPENAALKDALSHHDESILGGLLAVYDQELEKISSDIEKKTDHQEMMEDVSTFDLNVDNQDLPYTNELSLRHLFLRESIRFLDQKIPELYNITPDEFSVLVNNVPRLNVCQIYLNSLARTLGSDPTKKHFLPLVSDIIFNGQCDLSRILLQQEVADLQAKRLLPAIDPKLENYRNALNLKHFQRLIKTKANQSRLNAYCHETACLVQKLLQEKKEVQLKALRELAQHDCQIHLQNILYAAEQIQKDPDLKNNTPKIFSPIVKSYDTTAKLCSTLYTQHIIPKEIELSYKGAHKEKLSLFSFAHTLVDVIGPDLAFLYDASNRCRFGDGDQSSTSFFPGTLNDIFWCEKLIKNTARLFNLACDERDEKKISQEECIKKVIGLKKPLDVIQKCVKSEFLAHYTHERINAELNGALKNVRI